MKCPICRWTGDRFRPGPRGELFCPRCGSRSRWRHVCHALHQFKLLGNIYGGHVLLVGGSQVEAKMLAEARYVERMTGQNPNHGRVHLDLADMHLFQDGSFDLVMACHVLEHVHRLSKGLEEVYRVLRKGCSAVFCVPIPRRAKTIAFERADRQGHWYSVGRDWPDAYRDTGFEVRESKGTDCPVSYGVRAENIVSVCTRS